MLTSFMFGANDGNRTRLVRDHNALPVHLASFAVPVAGFEPARLGSSVELHGMLLTSTLVAVFCFGARALPRGARTDGMQSQRFQ